MIYRNKFILALIALLIILLCSQISAGQQTITWSTQADSYRGHNGQQLTFVCPAGGPLSSRLWGTNVYTDDSSICTAAVHAGYISAASGGTVTIEIRAGQPAYQGVTRNGVTSREFGSYSGSFVFVGRVSGSANADWAAQADSLRGRNGQRFSYRCPGGGPASGRLWGTDLYTDDSSICTAAVHAGVINIAAGGTVTIEIRPGANSYSGAMRNGVASKSFGPYAGSFVVVGGQSRATNPSFITWSTDATSLRGKNGQRFTFFCPSGGSISGRIWGTSVYTDDSSVCTAAVHAGIINVAGGMVTIEIRQGLTAYQGSTRNGVATRDYGSWYGSFVFVR